MGFALLLVISPDLPAISNLSYYLLYFLFGFLALAMGFLIFGNRRLMFSSLVACGLLCVFLKKASNQHIVLPDKNNLAAINIAHFNLNNVVGSPDSLIVMLKSLDPDIISFQEFTPDWNTYISDLEYLNYEYVSKDVRIDPFGMCVLSKYPLNNANIYYHKKTPNFQAEVVMDDLNFTFLSSYLLPPFNPSGKVNTKAHLETIVRKVKDNDQPSIVVGDFNMVYWEKNISNFRAEAGLSNSRREIDVTSFKMPFDHIFYTEQLECTNFIELFDNSANHLGIYGQFQLKSNDLLESTGFNQTPIK